MPSNSSDPYCNFYLDHSEYLKLVHGTILLSFPINIFTAYLIIFRSQKSMGTYKWHLLPFHVITSLSDLVISIVVIIPFMPFPMFYAAGFISDWGISSMWQFLFGIDVAIGSGFSCFVLFFYRLQKILPNTHFLALSGHYYVAVCLLFYAGPQIVVIVCGLIIEYFQASQEVLIEIFLKKHPCYQTVVELPNFYIFDNDAADILIPMAYAIICLFMVVLIFLISISFHHLRQTTATSSRVSEKTRRMQKKLMIHLVLQISIPLGFLGPPILGVITVVYFAIPGTQSLFRRKKTLPQQGASKIDVKFQSFAFSRRGTMYL